MVFMYVNISKRHTLLFLSGIWVKILKFILKSCIVPKLVWNQVTVFLAAPGHLWEQKGVLLIIMLSQQSQIRG